MIAIEIPIRSDSHNSYPRDNLKFLIGKDKVTIHLEGRDIGFDIDDFEMVAQLIRHRKNKHERQLD